MSEFLKCSFQNFLTESNQHYCPVCKDDPRLWVVPARRRGTKSSRQRSRGQAQQGRVQQGRAHQGRVNQGRAHRGRAHRGRAHRGRAQQGRAHRGRAKLSQRRHRHKSGDC